MGRKRLDSFPAEDGHIESILIGVDKVKISFQTWDSRKLVLIFGEVQSVKSMHSVYGDICRYQVVALKGDLKEYIFYSSWFGENGDEQEVLLIEAEKMEVFQVGEGAENNSAVFDVGYEYIGDQECLYYKF